MAETSQASGQVGLSELIETLDELNIRPVPRAQWTQEFRHSPEQVRESFRRCETALGRLRQELGAIWDYFNSPEGDKVRDVEQRLLHAERSLASLQATLPDGQLQTVKPVQHEVRDLLSVLAPHALDVIRSFGRALLDGKGGAGCLPEVKDLVTMAASLAAIEYAPTRVPKSPQLPDCECKNEAQIDYVEGPKVLACKESIYSDTLLVLGAGRPGRVASGDEIGRYVSHRVIAQKGTELTGLIQGYRACHDPIAGESLKGRVRGLANEIMSNMSKYMTEYHGTMRNFEHNANFHVREIARYMNVQLAVNQNARGGVFDSQLHRQYMNPKDFVDKLLAMIDMEPSSDAC